MDVVILDSFNKDTFDHKLLYCIEPGQVLSYKRDESYLSFFVEG